jgi:hypothetical protein
MREKLGGGSTAKSRRSMGRVEGGGHEEEAAKKER